MPDTPINLHATCVAYQGRAVLITGAAGSGKSALGLRLMAMGAALVADDRTILDRTGDSLTATCPAPIRGLIEARGIGLLRVTPCDSAVVVLAVTLDKTEAERLPPARQIAFLGIAVPLLHKVEADHFAAAILQYLKGGREVP